MLLLWQAATLGIFPAEHDNACKLWPGTAQGAALRRRDRDPEQVYMNETCAKPLSPLRGTPKSVVLPSMRKCSILHTVDTTVIISGTEINRIKVGFSELWQISSLLVIVLQTGKTELMLLCRCCLCSIDNFRLSCIYSGTFCICLLWEIL